MKISFVHKRIPTMAAFLILFVSIWVTSVLIQKGAIYVGRATPDKTPQNVTLANITDSSFTVAFTTLDKQVAAISVGEGTSARYTIFDDRDKVHGTHLPYYSHIVTVSNLKAQTTYQFAILSEGQTYTGNGDAYTVKTGPLLGPPGPANQISGKAILPDGTAANDTLVNVQIQGAQVLSAVTGDDGSYKIPIGTARTTDLKNYLNARDPSTPLTLKFMRQDLTSTVQILLGGGASVPITTLSYQYDFSQPGNNEVATLSSVLKAPEQKAQTGNIKITSPKENQSFIDDQPLFRGTALPNQTVKITIESNPIQSTTISDANGFWSYRPPNSLLPGLHKITIQTADSFGIVKSLSVNFTVFASGSQVAETATPSATPIVTIAPTATGTPVPTISVPTAVPTTMQALTPTTAPTLIPTLAPTTIPTARITTAPTRAPIVTPAPTGNSSTIVLTLISTLLIVSGATLLFLL